MNPSENIALVGFMASFVIFAMGNAPKNTFFETCPFIVSPCHFSLVFVLNKIKLKVCKRFQCFLKHLLLSAVTIPALKLDQQMVCKL